MSYCRLSSDDYACDAYVYEDGSGGWTTHVASNRYAPKEPMPPDVDYPPYPETLDEATLEARWARFWDRRDEVNRIIEEADNVPIGGIYDGESFNDPTPGACADRLEELRAAGYRVPQYAIDELREEEAAGDA